MLNYSVAELRVMKKINTSFSLFDFNKKRVT